MLKAMADAVVGDDLLDGDPTTGRLEERVADLLGHEAALFFPTGTQANQVAIALHTQPGCEVIVEADSHVANYEQAGAAALSGAQLRTVRVPDGRLGPDEVEPAIHARTRDDAPTRLVCLENTHNAAGGKPVDPAGVVALAALCHSRGVPLHVDGARLWNAAVALGVAPDALASPASTVMVSFSKGLGCPVGSCLAGSRELIDLARPIRRRFGGAMRQTGILAAAGLYALDHNLPRLGEDHAHAMALARSLDGHRGVVPLMPQTNIVMLDLAGRSAAEAETALRDAGVLVSVFGPSRLRVVTHLCVSGDQVVRAAEVIARVLA